MQSFKLQPTLVGFTCRSYPGMCVTDQLIKLPLRDL